MYSKRPLSELVLITKGRQHSLADDCVGVHRYIQIDDLRNDDDIKYTNDAKGTFVEERDVVIAWDGANAGTIGYGLKGLIGSTLARLHIHAENVLPEYLGRFLQGKFHAIRDNCTGATIPHVSKKHLESILVPIPTFTTQKHIARVLEQADQLRKQAQQMESELNQLAQSLFLEMFGDPISNPKGFSKSAITECFDIKTGKLDSNAAVVGGKYPFFTCAREDFWIDEFAFDQKAILLAGNNASADYSVKYYEGKFNAYQRTYIFSLMNDDWSYQYFKAALEFQLANLKRSSKGTNTKYLTMEIFRRIHLLVPCVKEQKAYESKMQEMNLRRTKLQLLQKNMNDLFDSLMQRAFNGELTERKAA